MDEEQQRGNYQPVKQGETASSPLEHSTYALEDDATQSTVVPKDEVTSSSHYNGFIPEILDLLTLSVPIAISRLAWVGMKTTDTALIGHTGTRFLTATALSDLYTSSTGVFIQGNVLSIFASQAVGSPNKKMAGVWAQVSLFVVALFAVPVMVGWACTGPLLTSLGTSSNLVGPAAYYAFVLMAAIPARVGVGQISQYFTAQRITHPLVNCGLLSMAVNLLFGLILVLGVPIPGWSGFGFWACAIVTVLAEWIQLIVLVGWYCCVQRLHEACWPGWSWEHITYNRVAEFTRMYAPAALSGASDWWRVTVIGVVCVSFGDDDSLAVFNSAYRILWMCLIFIGSVGGALSVKAGQALGAGAGNAARDITSTALLFAAGLLFVLAAIVRIIPDKFAMIFSSDPNIIALYQEVAGPLTLTMFNMNLSVLLERVPMICGRTKLVLFTGLIGSWGAQVPAVLLCTRLWRNDLYGLFSGVAIGYGVLDVILLSVIAATDWDKYAAQAKRRSLGVADEEEAATAATSATAAAAAAGDAGGEIEDSIEEGDVELT